MLESCVRLRPQCKGITWRKQQIHPWHCSVPAFPSYAGAASPSALGKVTSRESCNVESAQSGHLCRRVGFSPKMGLGVSASHETALARSKGRRAAVPLRVTVVLVSCFVSSNLNSSGLTKAKPFPDSKYTSAQSTLLEEGCQQAVLC